MKALIKILSLVLLAATLFSFAACAEEETQIKVGVLKGATGMGAVKAAKDAEATAKNPDGYKFTFYETNQVDNIRAHLLNGTINIAALPINNAAQVYNATKGKIEVIATNALGVLSIVGKAPLTSFADLKGKTIYTVAEGNTPEYIIKHIIEKNGLTYVKGADAELGENGVRVIFEAQPSLVIAKIKAGFYGMLPEPAATMALKNVAGSSIIFDVNAEWNKVSDTKLVQGCLVVNKEFAKEHPKAIEKFLTAYNSSVKYVNNAENIDDVSALMVEYGILAEAQKGFAKDAIPRANIVCHVGKDMKKDIKAMLKVLYNAEAKSVGGKLPGDDFYGIYEIE